MARATSEKLELDPGDKARKMMDFERQKYCSLQAKTVKNDDAFKRRGA